MTSLIALETDDKKVLEKMIENEKNETTFVPKKIAEKVVDLEKKIEITKERIFEDAAYYDYSDEEDYGEEYLYSDIDDNNEYEDSSLLYSDYLSSYEPSPRMMKTSKSFTSATASRGGFYGDPHFVIPIEKNLNFCFNWNNEKTQVGYFFFRRNFIQYLILLPIT